MGHPPRANDHRADVSSGIAEAANQACRLLTERGERVAVAETTTGGLIAAAMLSSPVSSCGACAGSIIAYSNEAKLALLGVDLPAEGVSAVSSEASRLLATAAQTTMRAAWGLAETGIAGPQTGRKSLKKAGLGYITVIGAVTKSLELLTGLDDRLHNQRAFAEAALGLLIKALKEAPDVAQVS